MRNAARPPRDETVLAGYYCIDTFTPLNERAYLAARQAVDCALTAASEILDGRPLAYALVRPPGHHAERQSFGGFCYFNNVAIAAHYLSRYGKVAILDLDYHHGNGQQDIFYERDDVLTVSVHGNPRFAYPYFSGFADETGRGPGAGFNLNIPLAEETVPVDYLAAVERALRRIRRFEPAYLAIALGVDTARGDPTGTWRNGVKDFEALGKLVGQIELPDRRRAGRRLPDSLARPQRVCLLSRPCADYRTAAATQTCAPAARQTAATPLAQRRAAPRYRGRACTGRWHRRVLTAKNRQSQQSWSKPRVKQGAAAVTNLCLPRPTVGWRPTPASAPSPARRVATIFTGLP